jgi:hypothetical protein
MHALLEDYGVVGFIMWKCDEHRDKAKHMGGSE